MFSQCPQSASWLLDHCSSLLWRGRYASYWNGFLLPPANKVCECYVFTDVCLSIGESVPLHDGMHSRGRHPLGRHPPADTPLGRHSLDRHSPGQTPPGRHPPPRQTPFPGRHPRCAVHAGIRSTSGRYASHWNGILYCNLLFMNKIMKKARRHFRLV